MSGIGLGKGDNNICKGIERSGITNSIYIDAPGSKTNPTCLVTSADRGI